MLKLLRRKPVQEEQEPEFDITMPTLAPAHNTISGINVIKVVEDHGLGQLADIDEEISKYEERIKELRNKRFIVLQLVRVFNPDIQ